MHDPIPDVLTALNAISGLYLSEGMPDFFVSGDEEMDWDTHKAIGWVDVADNTPMHTVRTQTATGVLFTEKISRVVLTFQFYCSSGADAASYSNQIGQAMFGKNWRRIGYQSGTEALDRTQVFHRVIMRFQKEFDLHKEE